MPTAAQLLCFLNPWHLSIDKQLDRTGESATVQFTPTSKVSKVNLLLGLNWEA